MIAARHEAMTRELDIAAAAHLLKDSREFLRMWAQANGNVTRLVNPTSLGADPALLGIALVDCVRARAWAHAVGISEAMALERIWFGVDAKRAAPTDLGKEVN